MLRELGAATHSLGPKLDAKLSADAKLMYFVRHNDLFALDIADGSERRLTFACQSGDDSFTAGVADYIMQEEFDRYSGFWPAPQAEKRQADGAIVYRVAYLHVDQSNVPKVSIQNPQTGVLETFRYPKAGQTNAVASIRVVEFAIAQGETLASVQLTDLSTKQTLNSLLANVEYVPRVGWAASSNQMWVQLLNRKQTELVLARLSIESDFVETQRYVCQAVLSNCVVSLTF
jgi:dipeptidyl-peptidase 9